MEAAQQSDEAWMGIEPWLNDALSSLRPAERDAVLMRYFDGLTAGEMAAELGMGEEAAGKRVRRAVERMRRFLARKQVRVSSISLTALLTTHATIGVPSRVDAAVAAAPSLPLPPIAHSLNPNDSKGLSTMNASRLTAGFCGIALLATMATLSIRGHYRADAPDHAATAQAPPTLLRYKFHPGDVQTYLLTQDQQGSTTAGGRAMPMRQQISIVLRRRIDTVGADGSATGTMQMTSMQMTMNGQPMNLPAAMRAAYLRPQAMTISPTGEVKATRSPAQASDPTAGGLWDSIDDANGALPVQPVSTGASWQAVERLPAVVQIAVRCTLSGFQSQNGHEIAQIAETFTAATVNGTGTEYFDSDLGEMVDNEVALKLDGMMNMAPPGAAAQYGHVSFNITMRMQLQPSA
jgi:hypothetical protein